MAASLVSAAEVRGATVRIGWFRRERVFLYGYDDGRYVVGYPLTAYFLPTPDYAEAHVGINE